MMGVQVILTVVTPATSYDLTTLAVVKDELSITDGSKDTTLKRYITSASAAAAQYCGRVFPEETVKDEVWPGRDGPPVVNGIDVVQLSRYPVVAVASVTENGTALVDGTDFRTDTDNGLLIRLDSNGYPRRWCAWPIVVQYSGGYSPIPDDVEDAVIRMVTKRYSAKGRDASLKQESIPGVIERQFWIATGEDAGNMTPDIADILSNYRVPTLA